MDTRHLSMMANKGIDIEANQVQFSLLDRRAENSLLPYCKQKGIKLLVFGVVAGGILSDAFLGLSSNEAARKRDSVSRNMYWDSLVRWTQDWKLFQELLLTLAIVGKRQGHPLTIAEVATEWALQRLEDLGAGGAVILGVRDAGHLEEHTVTLRRKDRLSPEDMNTIQRILDMGEAPKGDIWWRDRGWNDQQTEDLTPELLAENSEL
eukprot:TRINITY_DN20447_c1_g1_i1.p1 TRINITY_DN20447_c1_g1~~TRINITY_DN20447_c1_g1_i1.p1  ORF type:complete len:238 (-),score=53.09 TRINITY_DN20447_c1_g1_i1:72-692(-)